MWSHWRNSDNVNQMLDTFFKADTGEPCAGQIENPCLGTRIFKADTTRVLLSHLSPHTATKLEERSFMQTAKIEQKWEQIFAEQEILNVTAECKQIPLQQKSLVVYELQAKVLLRAPMSQT